MGKLKNLLIEAQELLAQDFKRDYRPFQPAERLDHVEISGAYVKPAESLLEGREWVPSQQTDVTRTWRRFGWRPIAEIEAEKRAKGET